MPQPHLMAFSRAEWTQFATHASSTEQASTAILSSAVAPEEVDQVYRPLAAMLEVKVEAVRRERAALSAFLGGEVRPTPIIFSVTGSVAAGKSTIAELLQKLLAAYPGTPRVDLVSTDGFLYSNAELARLGLTERKGFPESYNIPGLLDFLRRIKSGQPAVAAPIYDHATYDVLPDQHTLVNQPDVLILDGLNVLQPTGLWATGLRVHAHSSAPADADLHNMLLTRSQREQAAAGVSGAPKNHAAGTGTSLRIGKDDVERGTVPQSPEDFVRSGTSIMADVADFVDTSIYLDASRDDIGQWFLDRNFDYLDEARKNPNSFYAQYLAVPEEEFVRATRMVWEQINLPNLVENLEPTRDRADIVLRSDRHHRVQEVLIRRP